MRSVNPFAKTTTRADYKQELSATLAAIKEGLNNNDAKDVEFKSQIVELEKEIQELN